jgi:hypothetical protein
MGAHSHQPYPQFQLGHVTTIIDIGRRGAIREEMTEFVKCGWELGSAGIGAVVGEPPDVEIIVGSTPDDVPEESIVECVGTLEAAAGATGPDAEAIPPFVLQFIIPMALEALKKWLANRQAK